MAFLQSKNSIYTYANESDFDVNDDLNLAKDVLLNKNLKLDSIPKAQTLRYSNVPISRIFSHNRDQEPHSNMLKDIIDECKTKIGNYNVKLSNSSVQKWKKMNQSRTDFDFFDNERSSKSRYLKESHSGVEHISEEPKRTHYSKAKLNKTIFFSSSSEGGADRDEIPTKMNKAVSSGEQEKTSTPVHEKVMIFEMPEILNTSTRKAAQKLSSTIEKNTKDTVSGDTDEDPLACHADNIMRMALDSTMLGSSYNDSFSSSFGNTFSVNDYYPTIDQKQRQNRSDFDEDRSFLQGLKHGWAPSLKKEKAKKINISEFDLKNAINGDVDV